MEQNRPGMKGLRSPATKKMAKDEAKAKAAEEVSRIFNLLDASMQGRVMLTSYDE